MELTEGRKSSTASASLGAPTEVTNTSTVMSTVSSVGAKGTQLRQSVLPWKETL